MRKPKLIILGLDGGTFKIIDPLIKEGKIPNLQRLIREGTRAILKSTIPPVTAPAWVTLMTGVNPGKHGLFDFLKLEKITYDMPFNPIPSQSSNLMHSRYYSGKTIWDIFSKLGLKISVLMMPMTYPAWEINGYMLSGYPSPDFKNPSGYPLEWASSVGSLFDISAIAVNNEDNLIKECHKLVKKLGDIFIKQVTDEECDIYSVVFSSTDFLQHYLWKYLSNGNSKYSNAIQDIYIEIDKTIGRILDLVDNDQCTFIVLSDHGFTSAPKNYFHANAWLIREGYLITKGKKVGNKTFNKILNPLRYRKVGLRLLLKNYFKYLPECIQRRITNIYYSVDQFDWTITKAFRYRIGTTGITEGIVINLKGRQPSGVVDESEYKNVRDEIIEKLKQIYDKENGDKVICKIYKREELYKGEYIDYVPDIIILLNSRYRGGVGIKPNNFIENIPEEAIGSISGVHDMDGMLILSGPRLKRKLEISPVGIVDMFPTILFNLDIPIPNYVDGKVIKDAFTDKYASLPIEYIESPFFEEKSKVNLSDKEEEEMKKALKGLGYLS